MPDRESNRAGSGSRRRPLLIVGAVLVVVAGIVLALELATTRAPRPNNHGLAVTTTTTTVPPTSSSKTTPTTGAVPPGAAVAPGFDAKSASFVSPTVGFALGTTTSCPNDGCVALVRTRDGGNAWVGLPAPQVPYSPPSGASTTTGVRQVVFANELDGWAYGPSLFATQNGGATWQQVTVGGTVTDLAVAGTDAFAVVVPCRGTTACAPMLESSPVTAAALRAVLTGAPGHPGGGLLTLHAPVGFVVLGATGSHPDVYATEDLSNPHGWNPFPDPCSTTPHAPYLSSTAAPNATTLYSVCHGVGHGGSATKVLVETRDGKSTAVGIPPALGGGQQLAISLSGTMLLATSSATTEVYRSTDGGMTWSVAAQFSGGGAGWSDLAFLGDSHAIVVALTASLQTTNGVRSHAIGLLMSANGGASWTVAHF